MESWIVLILGVASLLQIMFLPGLLLLLLTGTQGGVVRTTLVSFALSLVVNFYLTAVLVFLGLFTGAMLYLVFAAELLSLLYLTRAELNEPLPALFNAVRAGYREHKKLIAGRHAKVEVALALLSLATLGLFLYNYLSGLGSIFDHGDDVISWNRWAVDWYQGYFPRRTWNYPQLLPANWSLSYVFLQESRLQFFAKSMCPVFSLFLVLALYDLWVRKRDFSYLCAIPVTAALLMGLTGGSMNKGYADVPVAFMAFMSVYVLLVAEDGAAFANRKSIVIGSICCAGAALTKQAGLYLVGIYPLLCYLLVKGSFRKAGGFVKALKIAAVYLLLFVLTAPWYGYTASKIAAGREDSEIRYVTHDIYLGRSIWGRLVDFCAKIKSHTDALLGSSSFIHLSDFAFIAVLTCLAGICALLVYFTLQSLHDTLCRYLVALIVVPYFFLWVNYFSYDFRNLTLVFPFLGLVVGNGMYRFMKDGQSV
jgi:hypothetical protein